MTAPACDFRWKTLEGEVIPLREMKERHIFNCVKMLWNELACRHGQRVVAKTIAGRKTRWSDETRIKSMFFLLKELETRPLSELSEWQKNRLKEIIIEVNRLGLNSVQIGKREMEK